jgi:YKOF-related Family
MKRQEDFMDIGVELSLYLLSEEYVAPIKAFIERLHAAAHLKVVTNKLSTQVFGDCDVVFDVLRREVRSTFESTDKAVFVMKVIGPYTGNHG